MMEYAIVALVSCCKKKNKKLHVPRKTFSFNVLVNLSFVSSYFPRSSHSEMNPHIDGRIPTLMVEPPDVSFYIIIREIPIPPIISIFFFPVMSRRRKTPSRGLGVELYDNNKVVRFQSL